MKTKSGPVVTSCKTHITINEAYPYHIAKNRINKESDIKHWVKHLEEKKWVYPRLIQDFKKEAQEHLNQTK